MASGGCQRHSVPGATPFEHIGDERGEPNSRLVYLGVASTPATWWLARWIYATAKDLPDPRLTDSYLKRFTLKYGVTAAAYGIAFLLAFWNWRAGLVAAAVITLGYLVPLVQPSFEPGQEPSDELEEAGG